MVITPYCNDTLTWNLNQILPLTYRCIWKDKTQRVHHWFHLNELKQRTPKWSLFHTCNFCHDPFDHQLIKWLVFLSVIGSISRSAARYGSFTVLVLRWLGILKCNFTMSMLTLYVTGVHICSSGGLLERRVTDYRGPGVFFYFCSSFLFKIW